MRQDGPHEGRIGRSLRRIGFDHNPVRRCSDRVEAIVWAGLVVVFLVGAPVVTTVVCHGVYVAGFRAGRTQAPAWHRVSAQVLHVTPMSTAWRHPVQPALLSLRWARPDGSSQTGEVARAGDVVAGGTVTVWTDQQGRLAHPPLPRAQVADQAIRAAVATPVALALLLVAVGGVVSLILDKRRLAGWEADWAVVEPQWTGRR
jgi:hypothetical protein